MRILLDAYDRPSAITTAYYPRRVESVRLTKARTWWRSVHGRVGDAGAAQVVARASVQVRRRGVATGRPVCSMPLSTTPSRRRSAHPCASSTALTCASVRPIRPCICTRAPRGPKRQNSRWQRRVPESVLEEYSNTMTCQ